MSLLGAKWLNMSDAPTDGTMITLLVEFEFDGHPLEDNNKPVVTVGFNHKDDTEVDEWFFMGWCWTHDHIVQGKGKPIGWYPLIHPEVIDEKPDQDN